VEFLCNLEYAKIMAQIANGTLKWHVDQVPHQSLVIAAIKKDEWFAACTDWVTELNRGMGCHIWESFFRSCARSLYVP
jgi:hypothetical protein